MVQYTDLCCWIFHFFFFYFNIRQCLMKENLDFHIILQIKRFSNAHAHVTINWHSGYALKTGHTFSTSPQTQYPLLSLTLICMSNATPLRCRIFSTWLYGLFVLLLPISTEAKSELRTTTLRIAFEGVRMPLENSDPFAGIGRYSWEKSSHYYWALVLLWGMHFTVYSFQSSASFL